MKNFRLLPFLILTASLLPLALYTLSVSSTLKSHFRTAVSNDPQINLTQSLSGLRGAYHQSSDRINLSAARYAQNDNFRKFLSATPVVVPAFKVFGNEIASTTQLALVILTDRKGNVLFDNQNIPKPTPSVTPSPSPGPVKKIATTAKKNKSKTAKSGPLLASLKEFPGMSQALTGVSLAGCFPFQGSLYEGALVPVQQKGKTLGVIILGARIDNQYVALLKQDLVNDLAIYAGAQTWCSKPGPAPALDFARRMETAQAEGKSDPPAQVEWSHTPFLADGFSLYDLDRKPAAYVAVFQPIKQTLTVEGFPQKTLANRGWFYLFLALLLSTVGLWIYRRPFGRLMAAMEEIRGGNLNAELPVGLPDEVGLMARSLAGMVEGLRDRDRISLVLGKVVSPQVAKKILEEKDLFALKGERREVTLLHADLRGFNTLSENMTPQALVEALNQYFSLIHEIVFKHEGMLDKFNGDTAVALWGAPFVHEDKEWRAVQTALEIQEALRDFNISRIKKGHPPFTIGIGIHTGMVVSGNLGSEKRYDYTVIGEPLHIAARLCSMAVPGQTVVSEETWQKVKAQVASKPLNPIAVKGSMEPLKTYELTKIL